MARELYPSTPFDIMALNIVAQKLDEMDEVSTYSVQQTWFDFGAEIWWYTIICETEHEYGKGSYQILYPKDYKAIVEAVSNEEFDAIVHDLYDRRIYK